MTVAMAEIAESAYNLYDYVDGSIRPERQKFYAGRSKVAAEQIQRGSFQSTLNTMMRQNERIKKGQLAFNVAKSMASRTKKNEEEEAHKPLMLGSFDVWALGIAVVIGGQYFCWNFALAAGFGSCFLSMMLVGGAYICLVVSNAELTRCVFSCSLSVRMVVGTCMCRGMQCLCARPVTALVHRTQHTTHHPPPTTHHPPPTTTACSTAARFFE